MINYFNESEDSSITISVSDKLKVDRIASNEGLKIGEINIVFCTNEFLLEMNKTYLRHDYYTDVITFDQSEEDDEISGDIYISVDQVKINAHDYETLFAKELLRVMIHGFLHLVGYDDKTEEEKKEMRYKEDYYINL